MLNYYQVLEIQDFAADEEIRKAYRRKCRQYHPDLVNNLGPKISALASREMAVINKAYEVLGAAEKRSAYDAWLRESEDGGSLRTCRLCGIHFTMDAHHSEARICPVCLEIYRDTERGASDGETGVSMQTLLLACFNVLHHFAQAMVLQKFTPVLNMVAGGEKIKITTSPGPLQVTLFNRRLFEAARPDHDAEKQPWNPVAGLGAVTFPETHPTRCAARVRTYCEQVLGEPWLEFCRISIEDEDFKSYEHILNQTALVLAAQISPWTASKLYSRHHANLFKALRDPDAMIPDPFFSLLAPEARPARPDAEKQLRREKERLAKQLDGERLAHERVLQRQKERFSEKLETERREHHDQLQSECRKLEREIEQVFQREKSMLQLQLRLLQGEVNAARADLEEQTENFYKERARARQLEATSDQQNRKAVEVFETYSSYAPSIPPDRVRPANLVFIIQNMAHEIQLLRAKSLGETRQLENELAAAQRDVDALTRLLARERDNIATLRLDIERHRRTVSEAYQIYQDYGPDVIPEDAHLDDLVAAMSAMHRELLFVTEQSQKRGEQLDGELVRMRRALIEQSQAVAAEKDRARSLTEYMEDQWEQAENILIRYAEFAPDTDPGNVRMPHLETLVETQDAEIRRLRELQEKSLLHSLRRTYEKIPFLKKREDEDDAAEPSPEHGPDAS